MKTKLSAYQSRRSFLAKTTLALGSLWLPKALAQGKKWNEAMQLNLSFEIYNPGGGRYNRPYIAAWIENANGAAVRTLALWVQTTGRGPRWIPDLRFWYRSEQARQASEGGDLVYTASGPTRNPGKYSLVWDGRNDKKALLNQGEYYVCLEMAREHGPYTLIRQKFSFGDSGFSKSLGSDQELKDVALDYGKKG